LLGVLIVLFFVIFAFVRKPAPVAPETTPETVQVRSQEFDAKVQQLADAHGRGNPARRDLPPTKSMPHHSHHAGASADAERDCPATATENQSAPNLPPATAEATPGTPGGAPSGLCRCLSGDEVTGQFATELYGKQMYITWQDG